MASRKFGYGAGLLVGTVLLIGITVFLNRTVANVAPVRLDLTEDKIYTVSEGAKNVLSSLEVPVVVTYYVTPSEKLPATLNTLEQDVVDKLQELAIASSGYLKYKVVDPQASEELEEQLIEKGIRPFQVQSVDRDELALKVVYSAISIAYKDEPDVILPQVLPQSLTTFEYELLSNVLRITRDENPRVAVYSTIEPVDPQIMQLYMQMGQQPPQPEDAFGSVRQFLGSESYEVTNVDLTADNTIPEDTQTLLVLAPRELEERQLYEISRVLVRGGNVIIATQGYSFDYNPASRGGFDFNAKPQPLAINDLLTEWGIEVDDQILMDEPVATLQIPRTQDVGGFRLQMREPVQAPMQIRVLGDGVHDEVPFTAGVPELLYLWGTRLILDDDRLESQGLEVQPVLTGTEGAWVPPTREGKLTSVDFDPANGEIVSRPTLAVLIRGTFPDPWAGEEVPAWQGAAPDSAAADSTSIADTPSAPGKLLVVGCAKIFEDMLLGQPGHGLFLLNSVDAMTLGDDLISIRSKAYDQRTIGDVSDQNRVLFRVINTALVPILVVVLGIGRWAIRRRESDEYLRSVAAGGASR